MSHDCRARVWVGRGRGGLWMHVHIFLVLRDQLGVSRLCSNLLVGIPASSVDKEDFETLSLNSREDRYTPTLRSKLVQVRSNIDNRAYIPLCSPSPPRRGGGLRHGQSIRAFSSL